MALDEPHKNDIVETVNGIQVAIADQVRHLVETVTLEKRSRGFVLTGVPTTDDC
ncbi:hypothetical protein [Pontibacillus sp. HMF3514]|uniref:hypothetical protein n=1 Tax=Pontibacillus sp. HMF3514 TaxID=2692425 RepID=UPI001F2AE965|nr:hypothetical protein [Pontibacillus sp. HMF3514]